ncbi:Heterogeneous nuclear ribonucleoprotein u-like protein 1 [Dirofilaria immitis]|nr:Heterogeneous nuclear ribonucleoprotein u-like protein 1 [Dirofilaria immitis]
MATRSRRSASGNDSLNPAMIQLYDTGRLRRELKQRGLDTTGTRNVLADRLQEAVLSERNSRQAYSPPPQPEKSAKRGTKRSAPPMDCSPAQGDFGLLIRYISI